mmetsp:Transcript_31306/g.43397  ORF Transcript_31306/g.43397 Transcript_31306/m.43397 type:complete len:383 (-) Transcript_31306:136-1284(-)|eukprot:CAMPEP_0196592130 /NCGR_PEP_ID=MMETSP1081-20130531/71794_1 /TAXON_ID=36882 /ORGANISM="Pyramimonas amylifera, Strain CCMP720" /LENGTH=382 /DNA_ID=CAMNT_0041915717 /DNA_START=107 /DNA_END=1255 /DNA_ORIENTATION=-
MAPQFPTPTGLEAGRWCPTGSGDGKHIIASEKIVDKINACKKTGKPFVSFEYFPPRTDDGVKNLYERLGRMAKQNPLFIDFTWGAGGSTSELTVELSVNSKARYNLDVNMHMTCTNQPLEKVDEGLASAIAGGIRNICALRGDPPLGQEKWEAVEGGFTCALDLVKHIRKTHGDHFGISVSGYPEGHPDNIKPASALGRPLSESEKKRVMVDSTGAENVCCDADYQIELQYLKEKVDAGAEVIITQLFYDADVFIQFVKDCLAFGIHAPILPGIMILNAHGGFKRMTGFCKTRVPVEIEKRVEELKDDPEGVKAYGIEVGADICRKLLASGLVHGLHFYTLNLEKSTFAIMEALGMKKAETKDVVENENTFAGTLINTVIKN